MTDTFGFIGFGLIGGSLAKAIRKYHPQSKIIAYDKEDRMLQEAKKDGVINTICSAKDAAFGACNYIFLSAPVSVNVSYLPFLKDITSSHCIISDVGSVKGNIHREIDRLNMGECFIGGHPMAGSEKTGYENSKALLLENAYYMLTPSPEVSQKKIQRYSNLVASLGAVPMVLSHEEHDYITASVSHLPHIIASTLVNLIKNIDSTDEHMKAIAAGGFRDITRIASSSPDMWQQICLENPENISSVLNDYIHSLLMIKGYVDSGNSQALYNHFSKSRDYRDSIDISANGPIRKTFGFYCDLPDEAGGIAHITTILAEQKISIKNIGIIHNREYEQGVLKVEFYDQESLQQATVLLRSQNYIIYER